ncbi:terpene synthase [Streptomyces sp. MUM 203J]|uniref:selina-4(15),7(11)-diene synthase n=1 Tax=Streptomyces sp. MUM 203J TaxID=2791990 RepID=UPI001F034BA8|nr:selina-4(15),7(11)-diene synthase [Streptomyces sp. MUM 203J]MCH0540793.1 terpene synthase [Streptomyces sp. MUM 203J]
MGSGLKVPPIYSPIAPAIHPCHAEADVQTAAWAEAFRIGSEELRARLVAQEMGTFAARILPEGREEVVGLLADFVLWLFGVDDGHCEEGELGRRPGELAAELHRLLRVAHNPEAPVKLDDPLAAGLRDLRLRVDRYGTPGQAQRWVDTLREYFFAVVWESSYRRSGTVPDLDDYTLMRLYDGATTVVLPLLEIGHGYELQLHERDNKAVRAVTEIMSFIITWDNDIFSYHKEKKEKTSTGYYLNALRVMEEREGLTPEQALTTAISQRDRAMSLYVRLTERLARDGSPQLRQYLRSIGHFIRGAEDWGISSVRYTTPDDPADMPSYFRDTPMDDSGEPLDIPVIRWWWDLLPETVGAGRTAARRTMHS